MGKTNLLYKIINKVRSKRHYTDNGCWVFGEWFGNRCCDNSLYFANYVAAKHPEIPCVWIAKKEADVSQLDPSVRVFTMGSPEAAEMISHAHFLFMNQGFGDFSEEQFIPGGPISVNFWHGVPWKKIGLDGSHNISPARKTYYAIQNKLLAADYYLAPSEDYAAILASSCGANLSRIIKTGYPRNALLYNREEMAACRSDFLQYLSAKHPGLCFQDAKLITYMPTFRDNTKTQFDFAAVKQERLSRVLEEHNAFIIQKAHFASGYAAEHSESSRILTENDYPSQKLLASSDILITDYSSCFFDFLLCDRPIIHYLYDYDYYKDADRGLYYDKEDVVGGAAVFNLDELVSAVERYLETPSLDHELRLERKKKYLPYENSESCAAIFDYLSKL